MKRTETQYPLGPAKPGIQVEVEDAPENSPEAAPAASPEPAPAQGQQPAPEAAPAAPETPNP